MVLNTLRSVLGLKLVEVCFPEGIQLVSRLADELLFIRPPLLHCSLIHLRVGDSAVGDEPP